MVTTLRRMALVLVAAAVAACSTVLEADPQPDGVSFRVDRDAYAPGDTVSARLENGADVALGYNLCFSSLQRQQDSGWTVRDEPLMICTAELRTLEPGESVEHRRELPRGLERGRYRLRVYVHFPLDGGSRVPVHSEEFSIVP